MHQREWIQGDRNVQDIAVLAVPPVVVVTTPM